MTLPRRHLKLQRVVLCRRTHERQFLLRPDDTLNSIMAYELLRSAKRHNIALHGFVAMGNHIHIVATDREASRSQFMRDTIAGVAKARNRHLNRSGYLWDSRGYHDLVVLDREAHARQLIYTWLNPVRAGLAKHPKHYPGFMILPEHWGNPLRIEKPKGLYGRRSQEVVEFTPQPPPGYEDMSLDEVKAHFNALLQDALAELLAEMRKQKRRFKKTTSLQKIRPTSRPKSPAVKQLSAPRFCASTPELQARAEKRWRTFQDAYRRARARWKRGKGNCTFPSGTLWLRCHTPIQCSPTAPDEPGTVSVCV
ncbi:hypothetical protein DL240_13875 [Lujinxingia litoralis]|uniref:Transposase IS200-like domain-containing protein n=1 Tax=Lujinxingia litoralis TaxID=2211119 RepID=A0A328C5E5_9DELT|nr:hypothetical protein [Lujinxingia litoralis]RAL21216.1 hypothetical protein DL240_13875 [Lujinxingia litoralis]